MLLFRCSTCGYTLIEEELKTHQCKHVIDYRIEENILWLSDGQKSYPRKLLSRSSSKSEHPNLHPNWEQNKDFHVCRTQKPNFLYISIFFL
jgi:hypothetical protein